MVAATSEAHARPTAPAVAAAHTPAKRLTKLNVLIVEEESYTRTLIRTIVRSIGADQVWTATGGRAALNILDETSINLVVCDLQLPDTTGLELLAELRRRIPDIPFLLISNQSHPEHIQQAVRSGVSAIIVRPFSRAQVETKLRFLAHRIAPNLAFGIAPPAPHAHS